VLRPFNFDTLATMTFNLASDERLAEAAGPALAMVVVGIVPVYLMARASAAARPGYTDVAVDLTDDLGQRRSA
jgi:iron(III) transport system permease protein